MPLSVPEFQVWIALKIMMGISPKPRQTQYWSKDDLHEAPFLPKHMPRDRFDHISSALHFSSNELQDGSIRLWKLGPIIEHLKKNCPSVYTPPQWITVNESLWKFRGRLKFVTYNPTKRARFGLKIYKLCVSSGPTCGYTRSFNFYTGQDSGELPASHKAVADLMESADLLNKGYTLFVDNWYTSPMLFHWLQCRKSNACGTVRANRKWMPKDFPKLKLNKVDVRSTSTGMCLKWVNMKPIHVLSTMHTSEMVETERLNRHGNKVVKPKAIIDYNEGMKGVDVGDQLAASYPTARSLKWYKKVFMYLFDLTMINAFALYKEVGGEALHQLSFREEVVRGLLREYLPNAPKYSGRGRPTVTNSTFRLRGRNPHVIREIEVFQRKGKPMSNCFERGLPHRPSVFYYIIKLLTSSKDFVNEYNVGKKCYFQASPVFQRKGKPMSNCFERGLPHRPSIIKIPCGHLGHIGFIK
ncbi:piggyBac transposable element-derived protein 4-like [Penaeus japonicus]|uniref:piggyBac transposable element-derived protein 4-like n=1 Tax=Penaeus japonicus TaxID=27405 RepID=UPI001C70B3DA|nr:piggyBac transposable element-derived protein 4-like [Penaeus japonicus]